MKNLETATTNELRERHDILTQVVKYQQEPLDDNDADDLAEWNTIGAELASRGEMSQASAN